MKNQLGNDPKRWDKHGVIIEALPFQQYRVRMDGSRRITLRNRKYLRTYTPLFQKTNDWTTAPTPIEAPPAELSMPTKPSLEPLHPTPMPIVDQPLSYSFPAPMTSDVLVYITQPSVSVSSRSRSSVNLGQDMESCYPSPISDRT